MKLRQSGFGWGGLQRVGMDSGAVGWIQDDEPFAKTAQI